MNRPAVEFKMIEDTPTIVFHKKRLDLTKATKQGLELLMEIALGMEDYEYAIKIRDAKKLIEGGEKQ